MRAKTKEQTGTLPYAISCRSSSIASAQSNLDLIGTSQETGVVRHCVEQVVRVTMAYRKEELVAIRHNRSREVTPYWLAVLKEDVYRTQSSGDYLKDTVAFQWLNISTDNLVYTLGELCSVNSPKCILGKVEGYSSEDTETYTINPEEDIRL